MVDMKKTGVTVEGDGGGEGESRVGVAGTLINEVISNPEIQQKMLGALLGLIAGLFKKKAKPVVVLPGATPQPNPKATDDAFPDDVIPPPATTKNRYVTEVVIRLIRAQYSRQRNPEMYGEPTPDNPDRNPQGLYENPRTYEGGGNALNIGAKAWLDLTAYDQFGKEFLRDAVIGAGLQYHTEHHVGDAFIKGNGGMPGAPNEGYETQDGEVGNGISAWISSMGFLHQVKFHSEGTYECFGLVNGVRSKNSFVIRVD